MTTLLKNKKILIVDDAQPILEIVKAVLNNVGVHSVSTTSTKMAKALVQEKRFDAILLDRHLEETDGHDFLVYLQSTPSTQKIPVIMLSGEKDIQEIKKSIALGAVGYIAKPFSAKGFLGQLDKILAPKMYLDIPPSKA